MTRGPVIAVYDACVLYPAPLRDLLMQVALSGRVRAHWSSRIHDEWKHALLRNRPDLSVGQLDRTSALMDQALPGATISGYEHLVSGLSLPDPHDRHVLAVALHCRASAIVTFNTRDFPPAVLAAHGLSACHPDAFSRQLLEAYPAAVIAAVRRQRSQLRNPAMDTPRYLEVLRRHGLDQTAGLLSAFGAWL